MFIVWEENQMRKCISIIRHEFFIQIKQIAIWGVLIAACVISLIDNLPTTNNLLRLEFLTNPAYFLYRAMGMDALILLFGLMFLLSNRFSIDTRTGVKSLIMSDSISKLQYVYGKIIGGYLLSFTMMSLFLSINMIVYIFVASFKVSVFECLLILLKTLIVSALPVSFFISCISVLLPAVIDIRLFYLLASTLFIVNASTVGSAAPMPFYLISSGDLIKLIWQHPKWSAIEMSNVYANLSFLIGCGFLSQLPIFFKRRFWRAE